MISKFLKPTGDIVVRDALGYIIHKEGTNGTTIITTYMDMDMDMGMGMGKGKHMDNTYMGLTNITITETSQRVQHIPRISSSTGSRDLRACDSSITFLTYTPGDA